MGIPSRFHFSSHLAATTWHRPRFVVVSPFHCSLVSEGRDSACLHQGAEGNLTTWCTTLGACMGLLTW